MKIVVIGGSGRIGEKLVRNLRHEGCRVVEASPTYGVDAVTGVGLSQALVNADIMVDVSNSPSLEGADALRFFETSGRNILEAGRAAGVRHHIILSIVGVDRLLSGGYFRAKKIQEKLVEASGLPFTILRSTQFFEFIRDVVQDGTAEEITISPALVQPIAGDDIADALVDAALGRPLNGMMEIAGPERMRLVDVAIEIATAFEDSRRVFAETHAPYFGVELENSSLLPGPDAWIANKHFDDWLRDSFQPTQRALIRQARR